MNTEPAALIIHCQTTNWMKPIHPKNIDATFYIVGKVTNLKETLMITPVSGNGSLRFLLCTKHNNLYDLSKPCPECANAADNPK